MRGDVTAPNSRHQQIRALHILRDKLISAGVATDDIDNVIRELAVPQPFERLYLDEAGERPVVIVSVKGPHVLYVPEGTEICSTHAGNLYDAHGNSPYYGVA